MDDLRASPRCGEKRMHAMRLRKFSRRCRENRLRPGLDRCLVLCKSAMSEHRDDIDWSLATWEGSRRVQLHHALTLTLRERMEAVEGMADVVRRFQEMRAQGKFKTGSGDGETSGASGTGEVPSIQSDGNQR